MKNKKSDTTVDSFKMIHEYIGKTPKILYADKGGEFRSGLFKDYCALKNINIVFSESPYKSSLVERAQRTFQNIMFKYMNHNGSKRYVDHLQQIVDTFNERTNRTIGVSPNKAYQRNYQSFVLYNLEQHYNNSIGKKSKPKFSVNTNVRILRKSKDMNFSRKAFTPNFTEEVFTIYKVDKRLPFIRYYVKDQEGNMIIGSFQGYELTKVP